ncbi:MAG TPA: hypothetical protein VM141_01105 [Planctomycetota bacterium]|nr:hypothetical protein [Planctomycetota bacterium]
MKPLASICLIAVLCLVIASAAFAETIDITDSCSLVPLPLESAISCSYGAVVTVIGYATVYDTDPVISILGQGHQVRLSKTPVGPVDYAFVLSQKRAVKEPD